MKQLLLVTVMLAGCNCPSDVEREKQRILQTDRDFAALSVQAGAAEAFKQYSNADVVLLPPNAAPVRGRDSVSQGFVEFDKNFILDWEPRRPQSPPPAIWDTAGAYRRASHGQPGNRLSEAST